MAGLTADLADGYSIASNRESGFGCRDVMLEPGNRTTECGGEFNRCSGFEKRIKVEINP